MLRRNMADAVYDVPEDQADNEAPRKPEKNFVLFFMDENDSFYPPGIYDGAMGPLPLLMGVNVGYDPEAEDPFMHPYESQEILFAYKKGAQKRILIRAQNSQTYSLPVGSKIPFCLSPDTQEEMTISEILPKYRLPLFGVQFARPDRVEFRVDRQQEKVDGSYFGPLTLTRVYEEPYLYCLSIAGAVPRKRTTVLPRNLKDVCFSRIVKVKGVKDSAAKLEEFKTMYLRFANDLDKDIDPFFQELALVSEGPEPVEGELQPYIENTTFIPITYHRRPVPDLPCVPLLPSRQPLAPDFKDADSGWNTTAYRSHEWGTLEEFEEHYMSLLPKEKHVDDHAYAMRQVSPHGEDLADYDYIRLTGMAVSPRSPAAGRPTAKVQAFNQQSPPPQLPPRTKADHRSHHGAAAAVVVGGIEAKEEMEEEATSRKGLASGEMKPMRRERPPAPPPVGGHQASGVSLMSPPPYSPSASLPPLPRARREKDQPQQQGPRRDHRQQARADHPDHSEVVETFTVKEVVRTLRELGLETYARKFKAKTIDGKLLVMLVGKPDVLMTEFKMTYVDFLKLRTYVREGHIPHTERSRTLHSVPSL